MTDIRTNLFRALNRSQKDAFVQSYMDHLHRRDGKPLVEMIDGKPDKSNLRFSVRESFFDELEANPVKRTGTPVVDQEVFDRNEQLYDPEPDLDERTLWALAVSKINRAEFYGVNYAMDNGGHDGFGLEDPMTYINIEEFYHTRILEDAVGVLGLTMQQFPPPKKTRRIVESFTRLPKYIANAAVMAAEIVGVAGFGLLRDKAQELFDDQPEPLARIDELFQQIMVDEVGHVHYLRSQLGPVRLKFAKAIIPTVTRNFASDIPELDRLFGDSLMKRALSYDVEGPVARYADKFEPKYE